MSEIVLPSAHILLSAICGTDDFPAVTFFFPIIKPSQILVATFHDVAPEPIELVIPKTAFIKCSTTKYESPIPFDDSGGGSGFGFGGSGLGPGAATGGGGGIISGGG